MRDLFIGVTTWNSAAFLPHSLQAIRQTTDSRSTRLVILDNCSSDATPQIARQYGAELIVRKSGQAAALIDLFNASRSEFTLLLHADVILLDSGWLEVCARQLREKVALLSPEDIGCGPYTRPWGKGMPESSFLFFRTGLARKTRRWYRRQRFKLTLPYRGIDVVGDHITYNLPSSLAKHGLGWVAMQVRPSQRLPEAIYTPRFDAPMWNAELAMYRYGLGNFYSIDGVTTHYHNWYERALEDVPFDSERTLPPESGGLPLAYLKAYTRNFIDDLKAGTIHYEE